MTEQLRKSEYFVANCDIKRARQMVEEYHYAHGASNTRTAIHGLYRKFDFSLMGVAWWLPPTRDAAASHWPDPNAVLTLSRLVLIPTAPKNSATHLLMRSVRLLDPRWKCLITYADTWQGHTGHIYRVAGWEYIGLSKPEPVFMKDGKLISRKAGPKTRTRKQMEALGALCVGSFPKHRFRLIRKVREKPRQVQTELFGEPMAVTK